MSYNNWDDEPQYAEFDLINLHTYDEFDYIILALSATVFAIIFCIVGWCLHKICVHNKVLGNTEDDIETLKAQLSMTQRGGNISNWLRSMSLRPGQSNTLKNRTRKNKKTLKNRRQNPAVLSKPKWPTNPSSQNPNDDITTPLTENTDFENVQLPTQALDRMKTIPSQEEVELAQMNTMIDGALDNHKTSVINNAPKMSVINTDKLMTMSDHISDSSTVHMQSFVVLDENIMNPTKSPNLTPGNDKTKISTPTFLVTPGVVSPPSNMPSQTHIDVNVLCTDYSENPYAQVAKLNNYKSELKTITES